MARNRRAAEQEEKTFNAELVARLQKQKHVSPRDP
jgi:hypothetical protein